MKKQFLFILFFVITVSLYGQQTANQNSETQVYQNILRQKITTMQLDVSSLPTKKITDLKAEYDGWHDKVVSVNIDFQNMIVSIEHSALWHSQEISEMLIKYNLPKEKILSDK